MKSGLKCSMSSADRSVSLMIPCYNGEQYLAEFLDSLVSQDYPFVQIIFADDGSTDNTASIYHGYEGRFPASWSSKYLYLEHSGQAAAVSAALSEVTGEYLMWSDADDIMQPGAISKKVSFLNDNSEYGMVRNDFLYYYPERNEVSKGYADAKMKGEHIFEAIFDGTMPCLAGTYMMRSSLMFECYPDRRIPLSDEGQNFQLLLPPCSRTKCGFIDEPLMKYRIHADSHSNRKRGVAEQFKRAQGFLKLRRELLGYCECDRAYYGELADRILERQKHMMARSLVAMNMRSEQNTYDVRNE